MFTTDNYFREIKKIDISSLPDWLQESHQFVEQATKNGRNWEGYRSSKALREAVDLHFQGMAVHLGKAKSASTPATGSKKTAATGKSAAVKDKTVTRAAASTKEADVLLVSRIPEELRMIRRFVNLVGKPKSKEDLLRFINALQKAIIEKRIRKVSEWAAQISYIQQVLIVAHNGMGRKKTVTLEMQPGDLDKLRQLLGDQKVQPSVSFIKRYIGLHEKAGVKEKAKTLLTAIDRAIEKGQTGTSDPHHNSLQSIYRKLQNFVADKNVPMLSIQPAELSGLQGILSGLDGCNCHSLNGAPVLPEVMSSSDFVKLDFPKIGFTGKWLDFIGDPPPGFTAMVSGRPKFGKSTLCLDFAGYLARQHGHVLYAAKEEGLNSTLQEKIRSVHHPRLTVASVLPADLSPYQYVFLDSITRLGLTPETLRNLKAAHPRIAFIYVLQVTKAGKFRGANEFQHDVDAVIEVPEWGKAVQMGRFNQGGEMRIF